MKEEGKLFLLGQQVIYRPAQPFRQKQPVKGFTINKVAVMATVIGFFGLSPQPDSLKQGDIPVLAS